jgi:hypothetical protein
MARKPNKSGRQAEPDQGRAAHRGEATGSRSQGANPAAEPVKSVEWDALGLKEPREPTDEEIIETIRNVPTFDMPEETVAPPVEAVGRREGLSFLQFELPADPANSRTAVCFDFQEWRWMREWGCECLRRSAAELILGFTVAVAMQLKTMLGVYQRRVGQTYDIPDFRVLPLEKLQSNYPDLDWESIARAFVLHSAQYWDHTPDDPAYYKALYGICLDRIDDDERRPRPARYLILEHASSPMHHREPYFNPDATAVRMESFALYQAVALLRQLPVVTENFSWSRSVPAKLTVSLTHTQPVWHPIPVPSPIPSIDIPLLSEAELPPREDGDGRRSKVVRRIKGEKLPAAFARIDAELARLHDPLVARFQRVLDALHEKGSEEGQACSTFEANKDLVDRILALADKFGVKLFHGAGDTRQQVRLRCVNVSGMAAGEFRVETADRGKTRVTSGPTFPRLIAWRL